MTGPFALKSYCRAAACRCMELKANTLRTSSNRSNNRSRCRRQERENRPPTPVSLILSPAVRPARFHHRQFRNIQVSQLAYYLLAIGRLEMDREDVHTIVT